VGCENGNEPSDSKKAVNILTSWATFSTSKGTLLHGVTELVIGVWKAERIGKKTRRLYFVEVDVCFQNALFASFRKLLGLISFMAGAYLF
jgi:hypothetical protein